MTMAPMSQRVLRRLGLVMTALFSSTLLAQGNVAYPTFMCQGAGLTGHKVFTDENDVKYPEPKDGLLSCTCKGKSGIYPVDVRQIAICPGAKVTSQTAALRYLKSQKFYDLVCRDICELGFEGCEQEFLKDNCSSSWGPGSQYASSRGMAYTGQFGDCKPINRLEECKGRRFSGLYALYGIYSKRNPKFRVHGSLYYEKDLQYMKDFNKLNKERGIEESYIFDDRRYDLYWNDLKGAFCPGEG